MQADYQFADSGTSIRSCSIIVSRPWLRAEYSEDARAIGMQVCGAHPLDASADPAGDLVIVDCPVADAEAIALLSRIAARAAGEHRAMLVSCSVESLDHVYAVLPHGDIPLLVEPSRGERVIALASILPTLGAKGVRELSERDRLTLARLAEQVGRIAERLDGLESKQGGEGSAFRFGSPVRAYRAENDLVHTRPGRPARLPEPQTIRTIIAQRQARARYFDDGLFADPAWDMLLDLAAARGEGKNVSVTSLCIASGVPPTTALRWIGQMTEAGLLKRIEDQQDRRRAFIALTDRAVDALARYFAEIGAEKVLPG